MHTLYRLAGLSLVAALFSAGAIGQTFLGPRPYLCSDDSPWPVTSPADLNGDGTVDDLDFQVFSPAYNRLECP